MKKILLITFVLYTEVVCSQSCVPDTTLSIAGVYSTYTNCFRQNQFGSNTYYFKNFDSISHSLVGSIDIALEFDSVANLPNGLSIQFDKAPPIYTTSEVGCFVISGTTTESYGQYRIKLYPTMYLSNAILGTTNVGKTDIDNLSGTTIDILGSPATFPFASNFKPFVVITECASICPTTNISQTSLFIPEDTTVSCPTGISNSTESLLYFYPDPTNGELNVKLGDSQLEIIRIYNADGVLVSEVKYPINNRIDVSHLQTGIYIAEISGRNAIRRIRWVKM